jgi:hypothetical protein
MFAQCASKVDLIILLDGSGGLGSRVWRNSQTLVTNCPRTRRLAHVQVSLLSFSGPTSWGIYCKYTGAGAVAEAPVMEEDCGISWVRRIASNTVEVAKLAKDIQWPEAITLASVEMAEVLHADHVLALTAVLQYGGALVYAPEELRADHMTVLAAMPELCADHEFVLAAVQLDGNALGQRRRARTQGRPRARPGGREPSEALRCSSAEPSLP